MTSNCLQCRELQAQKGQSTADNIGDSSGPIAGAAGSALDSHISKEIQEQSGHLADTASLWETCALQSTGQALLEVQLAPEDVPDCTVSATAQGLQKAQYELPEKLLVSPVPPHVLLVVELSQNMAEAFSMQTASPGRASLEENSLDACQHLVLQVQDPAISDVQPADGRSLSRRSSVLDESSDPSYRPAAIMVASMPIAVFTAPANNSSAGDWRQQAAAGSVEAAVEAVLLDCIVEACGKEH